MISLSRIRVLCCTLFVCFFGLIDWFVAAVVVVLLFLCCLLLLVIKPDMECTAYMHAQKNYQLIDNLSKFKILNFFIQLLDVIL